MGFDHCLSGSYLKKSKQNSSTTDAEVSHFWHEKRFKLGLVKGETGLQKGVGGGGGLRLAVSGRVEPQLYIFFWGGKNHRESVFFFKLKKKRLNLSHFQNCKVILRPLSFPTVPRFYSGFVRLITSFGKISFPPMPLGVLSSPLRVCT